MVTENNDDWLRVSCAALCRIPQAGRYLLVLNHERRQRGEYVLTPLGGALAFTDVAPLLALGARLEDPASPDLRLYLPGSVLPRFRAWFASGHGRECSPFRELHEELVTETRALPALSPDDMAVIALRTVERRESTTRFGAGGPMTHYFLELYEVRFRTDALYRLLHVPTPDSGLVWLTQAQIASGTWRMAVDGQLRDVSVRATVLFE
ncbi:MAG: hypothetical protein Kow00106_17500 [Anaerolineae bacterium]